MRATSVSTPFHHDPRPDPRSQAKESRRAGGWRWFSRTGGPPSDLSRRPSARRRKTRSPPRCRFGALRVREPSHDARVRRITSPSCGRLSGASRDRREVPVRSRKRLAATSCRDHFFAREMPPDHARRGAIVRMAMRGIAHTSVQARYIVRLGRDVLADSHGGRIQVESAPGRATTCGSSCRSPGCVRRTAESNRTGGTQTEGP